MDFIGHASKLLQVNPNMTPNEILNHAAVKTLELKRTLELQQRLNDGK